MVVPNFCERQANHLCVRILAYAILRRKRLARSSWATGGPRGHPGIHGRRLARPDVRMTTAVYDPVYDEGLTAAAPAVFGSAEATG
jgi:hypothetical protein